MPALTIYQIKNYVRRSFREIVDPSPDKILVHSIWTYFENRCAYCEKDLIKVNKDGHIDHLISASAKGKNHISNRVLSCATCNEKEKLDQDWEAFLKRKSPTPSIYRRRKARILKWIRIHTGTGRLTQNEKLVKLAETYAEKVNRVYEEYAKALSRRVRAARR